MTVLVPCQSATLKGSSVCLCSLHTCSTQQHCRGHLNTPIGALPLSIHKQLPSLWYSGYQVEPRHARIPSLEATGSHYESGALTLSDMGVID